MAITVEPEHNFNTVIYPALKGDDVNGTFECPADIGVVRCEASGIISQLYVLGFLCWFAFSLLTNLFHFTCFVMINNSIGPCRWLNINQLSGTIPTELAALTNLIEL
jgi:hypothetical protein